MIPPSSITPVEKSSLALQVVTDSTEFRALRDDWNNLAAIFRNPLYCYEWFDHCLTAFGEGWDLAVFVARADGAVRAIAPLVVARSGRQRRLQWLTHQLGDVGGFLYADETSLATVCAGVLHAGLPILLPGLGADSKESQILRGSPRRRGLMVVRPKCVAMASVRLDADWKTIESKMSSKHRKYIRWAQRVAALEGPVKFEVVSPGEAALERHLDDAFRVEAAGWKGRAGTAILSDPRTKRFWTEFAHTAARLGILRLFFLRIGNATAAIRIAAEYAGRLWDWKIGYDERWARYSPGILLTHETLRYASEQRLDALEFLGQAERWQHRWPIELVHGTTIRFYPPSINGGFALAHDTWDFIERRLGGVVRSERRTTWRPNDGGTVWD